MYWVNVMNWNITGSLEFDSNSYSVYFSECPYARPQQQDLLITFEGAYADKTDSM
jgi:hypothetical protein